MKFRTYGDLSTSITGTGIQPYTIPTSRSIHLNLPCIRLESSSGIFRSDTTLNSETPSVDAFLSETKLCEGYTRSNLDLSGNDINTGDFLCTSAVFDNITHL
jgi:hypothetical protein